MRRCSASRPRIRPAKALVALAALAVLAAGSGCGDNPVVLSVDLLSFVDAEERSGDYVVPPGVVLPPQTIEPQTITLPEGMAGVVDMERVDLTFSIDFSGNAQSGDGRVEVRLYFAAADSAQAGSDVYQTEPVYTGTAELRAGMTTTHTGQIEATEENGLLSVFESGELVFGMALVYDASSSIEPVSGQWMFRRIEAVVTGTGDAF